MRTTNLSTILKEQRKKLGLTLAEIADIMGVSEATVQRWESGNIKNIRQERISKLAEVLHVTPASLMGWENPESNIPSGFQPVPPMKAIPLVGQIACGEPITAEENIEDYVTSLHAWHADFALKCIGDSMEPKIKDGDIVAIRKQPTVENGQIAAVRIDTEATLKCVYQFRNRLILQPINPDYEPIVLVGEEINRVAIEGKAVGLCRDL